MKKEIPYLPYIEVTIEICTAAWAKMRGGGGGETSLRIASESEILIIFKEEIACQKLARGHNVTHFLAQIRAAGMTLLMIWRHMITYTILSS